MSDEPTIESRVEQLERFSRRNSERTATELRRLREAVADLERRTAPLAEVYRDLDRLVGDVGRLEARFELDGVRRPDGSIEFRGVSLVPGADPERPVEVVGSPSGTTFEDARRALAPVVPGTFGEAVAAYPFLDCPPHEWDNRTTPENADVYEVLRKEVIFIGIQSVGSVTAKPAATERLPEVGASQLLPGPVGRNPIPPYFC